MALGRYISSFAAARWPSLSSTVSFVLIGFAGGCSVPWTNAVPAPIPHSVLHTSATSLASDASVTARSGPRPEAAEIPDAFSLEQALVYTIDHHPHLRAIAEEVEVARGKFISASLRPNPQLVIDTDAPINESGPVEMSGRVMFPFLTGHKRERAMRAAEAGINHAKLTIDAQAHLLLVETVDATIETLYLQELLKLELEIADVAEAAVEIQRRKVAQGGGTAADILSAEVNAADIRFQRMRSTTELAAARLRLSRALGLDEPKEVAVTGTLDMEPVENTSLETLLSEIAAARPELAEAEAAIRKSRLDADAAEAAGIPNIELGPRYATDLGRQNDKLGMRLGMDLPWFDRKQGDVYEALAEARVNEALRDEVRIKTLHDVADAYLQLQPLEQAVAHYEQNVEPLIAQTEALLRDQQAVLALDPVKIADQLRKLGKLKMEQLELRYRHKLIRAKLELLAGHHLGESRESIPPGEDVRAANALLPGPPPLGGKPPSPAAAGAAGPLRIGGSKLGARRLPATGGLGLHDEIGP